MPQKLDVIGEGTDLALAHALLRLALLQLSLQSGQPGHANLAPDPPLGQGGQWGGRLQLPLHVLCQLTPHASRRTHRLLQAQYQRPVPVQVAAHTWGQAGKQAVRDQQRQA